ncbi:MAG: hypothetical protein NW216_11880 [Hyphomicrobium sp.]|nr:hypothetical protein [Hyphomicrobium sp.]
MAGTTDQKPTDSAAEQQKRQRMRSLAIALGLGFLVILFYAATIVRLGGNVLNRSM